jgi:uroporphyrinogen decarboxylase
MTSRERILCALNHEEADRVALQDSPWFTTVNRWHEEGLPKDKGPGEYFNFEMSGFGSDTSFQLPHEVVEDTEDYTIVRNANGALAKNWKQKTSTPEMIDFTIKDRKSWEEHKPLLAMNDSRVDWKNGPERCRRERERGRFMYFSAAMGYDKTQGIVGSERLLTAMAEEPEWTKDMFDASVHILIETAEEMIAKGFVFDGAFLFDDMGYRNASLFSPKMYRELLKPAHTRACDFFKSHGLKVILHSCGCVKSLVPDLIDAGFACLQPLEVKAGMDLVELKNQYGDRLSFMGGIDVRKMSHPDPSVIEEEIRTKVTVAKKGGGYIYHSDHSVPDDISFQQYCRVIDLVNEYGRYN